MMMQKIHDIVKKKWFAGTLFALISLAFLLWGVTFYLHPGANSKEAVATVNGQTLTAPQLNRVYEALLQNNPQYQQATPSQAAQLRNFALQSLVVQQIIKQQAEKLGLSASSAQVRALITQMPVFQVNGQFSPERFQAFLYRSGQTLPELMAQLQQLLLVNQLTNVFQFSSFVLPNEEKRAYELVHQTRSFDYAIIPVKRYEEKVKVTSQAIAHYYQQNQAKFKVPEKIKIAYIQLSPQHVLENIHVSDQAARAYYDNNLANYRTPEEWTVEVIATTGIKAKEKMEKVVDSLKKGASFSTVYQENAGKTKTLNAAQLTEAEFTVLRSLKPGELSQPISVNQQERLYHLLKIKPSTTKPFSEVKETIVHLLTQQAANAKLAKLNSELSNITYTNPDSLAPAAKALNVKIHTSDWFTKAGATQGIAANAKIVNMAFSNDVLTQGNNSDPITLKGGDMVVLRVLAHEAARVQPLASVKEKIHGYLLQQLAQAQAAIVSEKMADELRHKASFASLASKNSATLHQAEKVKQGEAKIPAVILNQAFQLSLPQSAVATVALPNGDAAVIELKSIKLGDYAEASAKSRAILGANLALEQARLINGIYVNNWRKQAKVRIINQKDGGES